MTTYYPDTCECVIEINDADPSKTSLTKACKKHEKAKAKCVDVMNENRLFITKDPAYASNPDKYLSDKAQAKRDCMK